MNWKSTVGKSALIKMLIKEHGFSKRKAENAVNAVFYCMARALRRGDQQRARGLSNWLPALGFPDVAKLDLCPLLGGAGGNRDWLLSRLRGLVREQRKSTNVIQRRRDWAAKSPCSPSASHSLRLQSSTEW